MRDDCIGFVKCNHHYKIILIASLRLDARLFETPYHPIWKPFGMTFGSENTLPVLFKLLQIRKHIDIATE